MPCSASAGRTSCSQWRDWRAAQLARALGDPLDRLRRGQAVGLARVDAGVDLVVQPGHADHDELVEVGGVDGEELDPLHQRRALVLGQLEHALVEVEPGQLAVGVELGGVEVRRRAVAAVTTSRAMAPSLIYVLRIVIWLLRHAEAEDGIAGRGAARSRRRDEEQSRAAGAALKALGVRARRLRDQPEGARGRDRAAGLRAARRRACRRTQRLAGGPFDPREVADGLGEHVLLVGHDPDFSMALHTLTGAQVRMKKGGAGAASTAASSRCCSVRRSLQALAAG